VRAIRNGEPVVIDGLDKAKAAGTTVDSTPDSDTATPEGE
jgi:hypothetical protein